MQQIPIIDLFAGPGGLGEGFSSLHAGTAFKIHTSAEMDKAAHSTLKLRAFYRILRNSDSKDLDTYYKFCNGEVNAPFNDRSFSAWSIAEKEALNITLGTEQGNAELYSMIDSAKLGKENPWVLIGGPPCQAYSVVGRSRNKGVADYKPSNDHRHFLYLEYLKTIQKYKPSVFVMENVRGILTSKVDGVSIFAKILEDLSNPNKALGNPQKGFIYKIYALTGPTVYEYGQSPFDLDWRDYIIKSEYYGIPQARHRVILLGVREDITKKPEALKFSNSICLSNLIGDMPRIRSYISRGEDSDSIWANSIRSIVQSLSKNLLDKGSELELAAYLSNLAPRFDGSLQLGTLRMKKTIANISDKKLSDWFYDENLRVVLNHESRGHMVPDLMRYVFASSFAAVKGASPKGHRDFSIKELWPNHDNWESGDFNDRFRVQLANATATTITSHISKDGHYFIHPDPSQCRSLSVREAARVQTFPDNYFFQGGRTPQYKQVGNAVPPLLARQIAEVVYGLIG